MTDIYIPHLFGPGGGGGAEREGERKRERGQGGKEAERQGGIMPRSGPYETNRDRRARSASTLPVVARSRRIYTPPCLPLLRSNILFPTPFTAFAVTSSSSSSNSLVQPRLSVLACSFRGPSCVVSFPFPEGVHPDTHTRLNTDKHAHNDIKIQGHSYFSRAHTHFTSHTKTEHARFTSQQMLHYLL